MNAAATPQEQQALRAAAVAAAQQVTSKGCSKLFILCALHRTLQGCRQEFTRGQDICFPFEPSKVAGWLCEATEDCCTAAAAALQAELGGVAFDAADRSTHWTEPKQLNTW